MGGLFFTQASRVDMFVHSKVFYTGDDNAHKDILGMVMVGYSMEVPVYKHSSGVLAVTFFTAGLFGACSESSETGFPHGRRFRCSGCHGVAWF